jgi:hypothetical protein
MAPKYQIFVSSTYEDLKEQREQAVKMILRIGHLPVGMEMFNAANSTQWEIIKRHIDNSDYYIVILAHRYGSMDEKGVSYTEKEYNYALEKGIPCLGFVIDKSVSWPPSLISTGKDANKLTTFKEKIKNRMVSFWTSGDNLASSILSSLSEAFVTNPRIGWVRANEITTSPLVAEELSRLSKENAELSAQLIQQSQSDELIKIIKVLEEEKYTFKTDSEKEFTKSLLEIFLLVCANQDYPTAINLYSQITGIKYNYYSTPSISDINSALDELSLLGIAKRIKDDSANQTVIKYIISEKGQQVYIKLKYN